MSPKPCHFSLVSLMLDGGKYDDFIAPITSQIQLVSADLFISSQKCTK